MKNKSILNIVLIVDTEQLKGLTPPIADMNQYCSFLGQESDTDITDYTTVVELNKTNGASVNIDTLIWNGLSSSNADHTILFTDIRITEGSQIFINGSSQNRKKVKDRKSNFAAGKYTLEFQIDDGTNIYPGQNSFFTIDPILVYHKK